MLIRLILLFLSAFLHVKSWKKYFRWLLVSEPSLVLRRDSPMNKHANFETVPCLACKLLIVSHTYDVLAKAMQEIDLLML